ncbi:Acetyltransferase (GNAT) family protein [Haloplanus vescus]|uniref:Acetyltransferase (GNAT) family protein n=1 Tax=Haloplanus vescus TaxID=555874 RepID=A0A1H3XAP4_9EURY|nr:GNAT family N-acetyltransferase [Haloplanus vescus]SDZ95692.1 Acetyltransferase (GNAT) family protein [Haloplanus vescus]
MTTDRGYPDDPAGPFPTPPTTAEDREGRSITVRRYDPDRDREALEAMYDAFDPADRAQGIPPTGEDRIADWLDSITGDGTVNVVACHGDDIAGHATLVPDSDDTMVAAELAIFVLQAYQGAGIGTHLIETLLGAGEAAGVERVWLTVERWNEPAISLYEKVGFRASDTESFEHEMTIRLH